MSLIALVAHTKHGIIPLVGTLNRAPQIEPGATNGNSMIAIGTAATDQRPKAQALSPEPIQMIRRREIVWSGWAKATRLNGKPRTCGQGQNCCGSRKKSHPNMNGVQTGKIQFNKSPKAPINIRTTKGSLQKAVLEYTLPQPPDEADDLIEMVIEMMTKHGQAKNWSAAAEIFDGESSTVMQHIMANGWLQQHIPPWCAEAQMTRGHIELKKCPPGGFYPGGRTTKAQNMEDTIRIFSACFCGSRWIRGARSRATTPDGKQQQSCCTETKSMATTNAKHLRRNAFLCSCG